MQRRGALPYLLPITVFAMHHAGVAAPRLGHLWTPLPPYFSQIAGGERVTDTDPIYRSVVALKVFSKLGGSTQCTGTLIAPGQVLTAAHCVKGAGQIQVLFGVESRLPVFETWGVAASYPQIANTFAKKNRFDVALVTLPAAPPLPFSPADILDGEAAIEEGQSVTIAGYGTTSLDAFDSGLLRHTQLRVADGQYSETEVLLKQTDARGACPGDSGGPAFLKHGSQYLLWGVANAAIGDSGICGGNAIYADARRKAIQERLFEVVEPLTRP